ncbi:MAG: ATP-binding protein [Actinomycetes bacterium]|jgi:anti-sigma regulatory factor (Ser/Thr protein kinase)
MVTTLSLDLTPEPMSAPQARNAIREFLVAAWSGADVAVLATRLDDALLVTTELVSNAIRHGSGHVQLQAAADVVNGDPTVCLECKDDGQWTPALSVTTLFAAAESSADTSHDIDDGGRGLAIIQALCSEVVITHDLPGSLVRAKLP